MKILKYFLLVFLFSAENLFPQSAFHSFRKLSKAEKCWVCSHPFVAHKVFKITQAVLATVKEEEKDTRLDGKVNGGQVDAFRHCYWMAMVAGKVGVRKAHTLGIAHERGNKQDFLKGRTEEGELTDSVASLMDLKNNDVGLKLRSEHPSADASEMKELVIRKILQGELWIINTDTFGNFLDCNHHKIDLQLWKKKWNIPKCLAPSFLKPTTP